MILIHSKFLKNNFCHAILVGCFQEKSIKKREKKVLNCGAIEDNTSWHVQDRKQRVKKKYILNLFWT